MKTNPFLWPDSTFGFVAFPETGMLLPEATGLFPLALLRPSNTQSPGCPLRYFNACPLTSPALQPLCCFDIRSSAVSVVTVFLPEKAQ